MISDEPLNRTRSGDKLPLTIAEAAQALRSGKLSSVSLTSAALRRADVLDARLGAYISRYSQNAHKAAELADYELSQEADRGPLHGIPVGIKDNICTVEGPTTAQSRVALPGYGRAADAVVARRLRRAGAVLTGKTSMMEFAIGSPYAGEPFPLPRNPHNLEHYAGGSSSGSATGVVAGFFLGSLGSDTGGSIRVPASWSGATGLKPTHGLVPNTGCIPFAPSLDHVGPIARSAYDCAALLSVIAGPDSGEPSGIESAHRSYLVGIDRSIKGIRVGVVEKLVNHRRIDSQISARIGESLRVLADAGVTIEPIELPLYRELVLAAVHTMHAEGAALHHATLRSRWLDYGPATRLAFASGFLTSAVDYLHLQRARRAGSRMVHDLFQSVDIIAMPTTLRVAPALEGIDWEMALTWLCTPYWNAVGNPAISIPIGMHATGLPVGLQLAAGRMQDGLLLRVAHAFQARTRHHLREPRPITEELP